VNYSTVAQTPGKIRVFAGVTGCLLIVGTVCAWLLYSIYAVGNSLRQVYLLKSRGQPAVARVTAYLPERRWADGRHGRHHPPR
jgi:hypothetical protein